MNQPDTAAIPPARLANDYLIGHKRFREPEMLFDEFWREGELALFFGAAGTGKSIFAVQLADALSRGRGLHGFRMPRGRRRTLYVDLRHTDEQFLMRCANRRADGSRRRPHRFPRNLLRDRHAPGQDLCEWLRAYVGENLIQAVIVDDLSAVKNTHDGTRETLRLVRRLGVLRDELHISILVIAESGAPPRQGPVSEADLGRSRVLCTAADSVFAAGRGRKRDGDHYFMQIRARSARPLWNWRNAPTAHLSRTATGLLSFEFDERFGKKMTEEKRRLICEIARLRDTGEMTFREIARQLGISKTWASDLYLKSTPAIAGEHREEDEDEWEDDEEEREGGNRTGRECVSHDEGRAETDQAGSPPYKGGVAPASGDGVILSNAEIRSQNSKLNSAHRSPHSALTDNHPGLRPPLLRKEGSFENINDPAIPLAAASARRSIYDLPRDRDGYGHEVYIESRCEHTGKPAVWYKIDKEGIKRRFTRNDGGIRVENLDPGPFF